MKIAEIMRKLKKLIAPKIGRLTEVHPELYHYTDFDGLKGIIKSKTIWAIHYSCLNDSQEMLCFEKSLKKYCLKSVAVIIKKLKIDEKKLSERFLSENPVSGIARLSSEILRKSLLETQDETKPFVASFCSVDDKDEYVKKNGLLSQWRGYGSGGGYALVFDTRKLEELIESERYAFVGALKNTPMLEMGEVIYTDEDAHNRFPAEMYILKEFVCWMTENWFTRPEKIDSRLFSKAVTLKMMNEYLPAFMRCMPRCKHQGFKEEREIRIVAFVPNEKYFKGLSTPRKEIKIYYSEKKQKQISYLELFSKASHEKVKIKYPKDYLGIKRIIVGPSIDKEARANELKKFLEENKMEVEVTISATPFV